MTVRGELPQTTVTLLFADVVGSTGLARRHPAVWGDILAELRCRVGAVITTWNGRQVSAEGDELFAAFEDPADAVAAALDIHRALAADGWPGGVAPRVRIGAHIGRAQPTSSGYVGLTVHLAARIAAAAQARQVLLSEALSRAVDARLPSGSSTRDLGDHALKDFGLQRLHQLCHPELPQDLPPSPAAAAVVRLPNDSTSFIGRVAQRREVTAALEQHRLVTLVAPGGTGKTRLGVEVAGDVAPGYSDGVAFIDLAQVPRAGAVAPAVARVLTLVEDPARSSEDLVLDFLSARRMLLVLDNCEHVVDSAAQFAARVLDGARSVTVLATTREALRVRGERVIALPGMSTAEGEHDSEASELFLARAHLRLPDEPETRRAIADICRRLEGLPLAIELAATRTSELTPEQIAARLDDRFRLLSTGERGRPSRQQTLRSAVDWSYDLLSHDEQAALRAASVFVGGFSLDAAEAVLGGGHDRAAVSDAVARLVATSLLVVDQQPDGLRYRMLETIREYAGQRLEEQGEASEARRRHCWWVAAFTGAATRGLISPEDIAWYRRVDTELGNVVAAIRWGAQHEPEPAARAVGDLWSYWTGRRALLGRELAGLVLREPERLSPAAAARAHATVSHLCFWLQDIPATLQHAQASGRIGREQGDPAELAWSTGFSLLDAGVVAEMQGRGEQAAALYEQALALGRRYGNDPVRIRALRHVATAARARGDHALADVMLDEALEAVRRPGPRLARSRVLLSGVPRWLIRGDEEGARAVAAEALVPALESGDGVGISVAADVLAWLSMNRGEIASAELYVEQSLKAARELGQQLYLWRAEAAGAWVRARSAPEHGPQRARLEARLDDAADPALRAELLRALGHLALRLSGAEEALAMAARAREVAQSLDQQSLDQADVLAAAWADAADAHAATGQWDAAEEALREELALRRVNRPPRHWHALQVGWFGGGFGGGDGTWGCLLALADVALRRGRVREAGRMVGAAVALGAVRPAPEAVRPEDVADGRAAPDEVLAQLRG